jgi:hypothetical protein
MAYSQHNVDDKYDDDKQREELRKVINSIINQKKGK